jgi:hypothetical protein
MKKRSFQARLERVKKQGSLTTADLSILLRRPYHTIRGWLYPRRDRGCTDAYKPWGALGDEAERFLSAVEKAIEQRRGFPVPYALSPPERLRYVTRISHDLNGRLPKTHSAS